MPGARTFTRSVQGIALASIIIAVVLFAAVSASAAKVTPEFIEGTANKTCQELAKSGQTWSELKVDPNADGQYSDGKLTVTISNTTDDKTFDWSSNIGVDAVFVKAGSGGSFLYRYDDPTSDTDPGEQTSDTGLTSPETQGNQISHIAFCYDVESPSPSPSPSVSPSETETPSPSPSPSVSPSETETPSASPTPSDTPTTSVLPTTFAPTSTSTASVLGKKLTSTGADVIRLIQFALALVVLGAAAYVISTRAARNKA